MNKNARFAKEEKTFAEILTKVTAFLGAHPTLEIKPLSKEELSLHLYGHAIFQDLIVILSKNIYMILDRIKDKNRLSEDLDKLYDDFNNIVLDCLPTAEKVTGEEWKEAFFKIEEDFESYFNERSLRIKPELWRELAYKFYQLKMFTHKDDEVIKNFKGIYGRLMEKGSEGKELFQALMGIALEVVRRTYVK
jgi:hypothetical protein